MERCVCCEDINAILELLTPDYVLWAPGAPPTTRELLAPRLAAAFRTHYLVPSLEREEQLVSGDLAFERGWDIQEIRPRAGGDAMIHRQRFCCLSADAMARGVLPAGCHKQGHLPNQPMKPIQHFITPRSGMT